MSAIDTTSLQQRAQDEIDAALAAQNNPLKNQIGTLGGQEAGAHKSIADEFAGLMPFVQSSANAVGNSYESSLQMEQSIFQAAGQRMNQLKQDRAAEAQQLAQQMGGPVATGEFTQGLTPYESQMPASEASNMLHGLGLAQAGVQEAQQFAGQVMPALQTEQEAKSDEFFNNQIKSLNDQINQNNASRSTLVNDRLSQLTDQERTYKLNQAQLKLEQLKSQRDWLIAQKELGLKTAAISGTLNGKPTLEAVKLNAEQKLAAAKLGLSEQQYQLAVQKASVSEAIQTQRLNLDERKNAMSVLDAAMSPGKPVTLTVTHYIPKNSPEVARAALGKISGAHYDTTRHQWYYYQRETLTADQWSKHGGGGVHPITDPNRLYDLVRGSTPGLSKQAVVKLVRAKTGLSNWSPGQQTTYTGKQLHSMTLKELDGIARDKGYKGNFKSRQAVTDFILGHG